MLRFNSSTSRLGDRFALPEHNLTHGRGLSSAEAYVRIPYPVTSEKNEYTWSPLELQSRFGHEAL